MKVTFIGHAAILIEANGLRVLSDPWWHGPCFASQWWIYPRPYLQAVESAPIDYIYISHGHSDHFHRGTLRRFPKGTKMLVSAELDLAPALREMDFDVIEVGREEERELGQNVHVRIIPTYGGDTLMALSDRKEICINANDALHAAPRLVQDTVAEMLKRIYPKIDYVFCGYGVASHFPNCYVIPGKDKKRTAAERQKHFSHQWIYIIRRLAPRYGFPFAADVIFLDPDLMWLNEAARNVERPGAIFAALHPITPTEVVDIAPGFIIDDGAIASDVRFRPIRDQDIRRDYADALARDLARSERTSDGLELLTERLEQNVAICRPYLLEYPGDYRFLLRLRDRTWALQIIKRGREISIAAVAATVAHATYDIVLTSYFSYVRRSFTTEYGNETLFVGSGCLIEYHDRRRIADNLHREFMVLLAKRDEAPSSRFGDQPKWKFEAKQRIKWLLGRRESDLYDLSAWTWFT